MNNEDDLWNRSLPHGERVLMENIKVVPYEEGQTKCGIIGCQNEWHEIAEVSKGIHVGVRFVVCEDHTALFKPACQA